LKKLRVEVVDVLDLGVLWGLLIFDGRCAAKLNYFVFVDVISSASEGSIVRLPPALGG
jgi:hypothetical protein